MMSVTRCLQMANSALDETSLIARRYFRQAIDVRQKEDGSPVAVADLEIEALLRNRIQANYPSHGVLGEEQGAVNLTAEYCWIIDPIDGTKSFISGMPLWGTLLALLHKSKPLFGIIDVPALGERYISSSPNEARRNGHRIRTSGCEHLATCILFATTPDMFNTVEYEVFDSLSRRAQFRRFGGDCYSYAMLAAGTIDAVIEAGLKPHDYLPVLPLVTGAGGMMTDWSGKQLTPASDGRVIAAATPALHQELLKGTAQLNDSNH